MASSQQEMLAQLEQWTRCANHNIDAHNKALASRMETIEKWKLPLLPKRHVQVNRVLPRHIMECLPCLI